MKQLFTYIFLVFLVGCGVEDQSSDGKKDESLDISRFSIDLSDFEYVQQATIEFAFTADDDEASGWDAVAVVVKGDKAVKSCDTNKGQSAMDSFWVEIEGLEFDTEYSIRVCAFNGDLEEYSEGKTDTFKTPKQPSDELEEEDEGEEYPVDE